METLNEKEKETIIRLAGNTFRLKHKYIILVRKKFRKVLYTKYSNRYPTDFPIDSKLINSLINF